MKTIDLRSDTVTRPTAEMRRAIAEAEVGDDALGDDPTVQALEERVAELLGQEAALFCPSGIMANQLGISALAEPGTEVIVEASAHLLHYEEGSAAANHGVQYRAVPTPDGRLTADLAAAAIRPASRHLPRTRAIAVENSHLDSGGRVHPVEEMRELRDLADEHGLGLHLDGARLWNAAAATGRPVSDWAGMADTVMVCLSKGLGAPVGSLVASDVERIEGAWRVRRRLGGQMRQAGILAAAGLYALDRHRDRFADDHAGAQRLAEALEGLPGLEPIPPETNILIFTVRPPAPSVEEVLDFCAERGILMLPFGKGRIRAVFHLGVDPADVEAVAETLEKCTAR